MSIAEQVNEIRRRIAGLSPSGPVFLVAASKMNDAPRVQEAIAAGVDGCGENKVQEFLEKDAQGAYRGAPVHFIGHLQRNKVNKIVGKVDLIQSVDSEELLRLIDRKAASLGIVQDVLIEVSIAGEEQKSGIAPEELEALLAFAGSLNSLRVRGLMCVPPVAENPQENRPYFARMKQLFVDNSRKKYDNVSMDFLSMGMTDDYLIAIEEGANMVRIGSAIFGRRNYGGPASHVEEEQHGLF